jgi:hypothetical protein
MEQIAARHLAGEMISTIAPTIELSEETRSSLPDAVLEVDVRDWTDVPNGVEVILNLTWSLETGRAAAPVELHAYFIEASQRESGS